MKVEQAVFGEQRGGHALREASGNKQFADELSPKLDLPDTSPAGIAWSPYISGFPHGDHYVFARTFLDPQAPRTGMVFSHALIVPLREVVECIDLRPLLNRLLTEPRQSGPLLSFDVELSGSRPPASSDLAGTAEALTTRGNGPVVRAGVDRFDELIVALWARLWPAIRAAFSYRISFGPNDIIESPSPTIVCTPAALITRWRGHRMVDVSIDKPASISAALLSDDGEGQPMQVFRREIGAELRTFSELPLLEQAYRLAKLEPDTVAGVTSAIRLVEKLSPLAETGEPGKTGLIDRLSRHIEGADATAILVLRNLQLDAFEQRAMVWMHVQRWTERNTFPATQDESFLPMIEDAARESGAVVAWRKAIIAGLRAAAHLPACDLVAAVWRWIELRPSILGPLMGCIEVDADVERRLARVAPRTLQREAAHAVMHLANKGKLPLLHAVAVSTVQPGSEAVRSQMEMAGAAQTLESIGLALRNAEPAEVLTCALQIESPQLIELAARAVADQPTLLIGVDMRKARAQAIWRESLSKNPTAWRGPDDPISAFSDVLENLLIGGPADPELVAVLATTPLADLSSFRRRADVWNRLSGSPRSRLLSATAKSWIEQSRTGSAPFTPDPDLQGEILGTRELRDAMDGLAASQILIGIKIVAALPSFGEERFLRWLQSAIARTRVLPVSDAEGLGQMVLERRWRRVVDELVHQLRRGREDLRPALRICISMINLVTRWILGLSALTPSEKWESLEAVAVDLYPSGPDHNELWGRAGGSDADLPLNGSGRSRWHEVLGQMQRGARGLRINQLLHEMLKDYPMNENLRFLASDHEFGGRR